MVIFVMNSDLNRIKHKCNAHYYKESKEKIKEQDQNIIRTTIFTPFRAGIEQYFVITRVQAEMSNK